jgi:hypothetical protein
MWGTRITDQLKMFIQRPIFRKRYMEWDGEQTGATRTRILFVELMQVADNALQFSE